MPPHHLLSRCAYGAVGAFCGFGLSSAHADAHPARRHHGTGFSLLATPNMRGLASEILEAAPELFEEGGLSMATFNDGTPKVAVDPGAVMHKDVVLLADYDILHGGEGWVATLGLIYSLPRYRAHSLTVVLPFFPMGTMERVLVEGEVATAMTFARMLSATPQTMHGPTQFLFYDIHSLQNRFYFSDQVLPLLTTAIPLLKNELQNLQAQGHDVAVAFPDDGAKKRFWPEFQGGDIDLPVIVCSKTREEDKRVLKITEGMEDVRGRHVVVVDDLVQSGGTMINCKDLLLASGASEVSGYVTHGVFPKASWERFLDTEQTQPAQRWSNFWITNSIPTTAAEVADHPPFKVLSLAPRVIEHFKSFDDVV